MPRVSRRSKRRRHGYDDEQIRHLLQGYTFITGKGFSFNRRDHDGGDIEAMRKAWDELRHELLPQWIAEHPGTRPAAWWRFDAPERRQRTDGIVHPFDDRVRRKRVEEMARQHPSLLERAYRLLFGIPSFLLPTDDFRATYESEFAYLHRLDLLTDTERKELL
jgi:hypothetical protein